MLTNATWVNWFIKMFKEFIAESTTRSRFEIVDIYECSRTGFIKAVVKLSGRHTVEKNISDIVTDNHLIEGLDKKTIRTLTYMATKEKLKPDYLVVTHYLCDEVDEAILEIKSRKHHTVLRKSPTELSKDKSVLSKLSPLDANRIGYLAGIRETIKDFQIKSNKVNTNDSESSF